ncbi:MAG: hypothetical protein IJ748_06135 [Bacteroidales bacterium]|nr:hypothetical protein [Bacteroidales bacterium]
MKKKINIGNKNSQLIKIKLNNKDSDLLRHYCKLNNLTSNTAAKKIVREFLNQNVKMPEKETENQLSLFNSIEMDIFDFIK